MSPQEKNMIREKPQEKDPVSEARARLWDLKLKEEEAQAQGAPEATGHFKKINIADLPEEDILFYIEAANGRLNESLVDERRNKLIAENASESRLEFIGYIANLVLRDFFDRR